MLGARGALALLSVLALLAAGGALKDPGRDGLQSATAGDLVHCIGTPGEWLHAAVRAGQTACPGAEVLPGAQAVSSPWCDDVVVVGDHQNGTSGCNGEEEDGIHCVCGEHPTDVATSAGMCCQAPYAAQSGRNESGVDLTKFDCRTDLNFDKARLNEQVPPKPSLDPTFSLTPNPSRQQPTPKPQSLNVRARKRHQPLCYLLRQRAFASGFRVDGLGFRVEVSGRRPRHLQAFAQWIRG